MSFSFLGLNSDSFLCTTMSFLKAFQFECSPLIYRTIGGLWRPCSVDININSFPFPNLKHFIVECGKSHSSGCPCSYFISFILHHDVPQSEPLRVVMCVTGLWRSRRGRSLWECSLFSSGLSVSRKKYRKYLIYLFFFLWRQRIPVLSCTRDKSVS